MVEWSFNETQLEQTLAEWLAERGRTVADPGEEIAELILHFLHSNEMRDVGLSEWDIQPS